MTTLQEVVTPAKAGVQNFLVFLDSGFRRNDGTHISGLFGKYLKITYFKWSRSTL